jgi:heme/copper-type cytochrome/quinol oxidase subunit 2
MRDMLGDVIFWIAAVCCLVAQVAIIRSAFTPYQPASGSERVPLPRPRTGVEVAWTLLPALLLIGVFALTWHTMHRPRSAPASLRVSAAAAAPAAPRTLP